MPCSDQTEILEILLDDADRLRDFRLFKRTCGQPVGGMTLLPYVQGKSVDTLLGLSLSEIVPSLDAHKLTDEFLLFKQFFSLRSAFAVYLGQDAGSPSEAFVLEEIAASDQGLLFVGEISIAIVRDKIRACGGCRSCSVSAITSLLDSPPEKARKNAHDSLFD